VSRGVASVAVLLGLFAVAGAGFAVRGLGRGSAGDPDVPAFTVAAAPFARVVTAEGTLRPVKATPVTAPGEGRSLLIAWMAEDGAAVKKGDVVVRFDKVDATRALADGQDDERAAAARIEKEQRLVGSAVTERGRAAQLTKTEIVHARSLGKKDPRFFPRSEVIESEIDEGLLQTRLDETEAAQVAEKRLGKSRVDLLAVDRHKAQLQRAEAQRMLSGMEVRAPHDGMFLVQRLGWSQRMLQTGDRAYPGMRVAEVATSERMEADVMVLEADAGGLAVGKRAEVSLEARPEVVLAAKVKKVEPFPKTRHFEVPTQYFGAILSITGDTAGLKPGQRLRANIVLDDVPSALSVPRQAVVTKAQGAFVQRKSGSGWEPVKVTLGAGTVGRVVVTAGLQAGDVIALRDPNRSADETMESERRPLPRAPGGGSGRGGRQ
jgi:multidrug efflux pump subunit AcrA (membrane-fusion protein)